MRAFGWSLHLWGASTVCKKKAQTMRGIELPIAGRQRFCVHQKVVLIRFDQPLVLSFQRFSYPCNPSPHLPEWAESSFWAGPIFSFSPCPARCPHGAESSCARRPLAFSASTIGACGRVGAGVRASSKAPPVPRRPYSPYVIPTFHIGTLCSDC